MNTKFKDVAHLYFPFQFTWVSEAVPFNIGDKGIMSAEDWRYWDEHKKPILCLALNFIFEVEHDEFYIKKINEEKLKDIEETKNKILEIGIKIKNLREKGIYICPNEKVKGEGCRHCRDFEKIYKFIENRKNNLGEKTISLDLDGEEMDNVEYLGVSDYNQDMYFVK
jgi:hypothetical protein